MTVVGVPRTRPWFIDLCVQMHLHHVAGVKAGYDLVAYLRTVASTHRKHGALCKEHGFTALQAQLLHRTSTCQVTYAWCFLMLASHGYETALCIS